MRCHLEAFYRLISLFARKKAGARVAGVLLVAFLATPTRVPAQPHAAWLTGSALLRQREQPLSVNWMSMPARNGLARLSRAQQVAILLDRRIDPEQPVDLMAKDVLFDPLLERIASRLDAAVTWLGPLAYVGPKEAARRLRTLSAMRWTEIRALPKVQRDRLLREASWQWDDLAEPRSLVAELASQADVTVENLDLIPHDLWAAADLPPLGWTDRLTLLANEFDLTFQFVGQRRVRLMPIVEPVVIERKYPTGSEPADDLVARWKHLAPDAEIERSGTTLTVRGRLEDHELLQPDKPKPTVAARPGVQVYTLSVTDQPLRLVIEKLRASSIELLVDEAALEKANLTLDARVSFSVERASLEKLLETALRPAGLAFRREGKSYRILPRQRADDDAE